MGTRKKFISVRRHKRKLKNGKIAIINKHKRKLSPHLSGLKNLPEKTHPIINSENTLKALRRTNLITDEEYQEATKELKKNFKLKNDTFKRIVL